MFLHKEQTPKGGALFQKHPVYYLRPVLWVCIVGQPRHVHSANISWPVRAQAYLHTTLVLSVATIISIQWPFSHDNDTTPIYSISHH